MSAFKLGETDAYSVTHFIYYIGLPVVAYKAIQFGKAVKTESIVGKALNGNIDISQILNGVAPSTTGASIKGFSLGIAYLLIVSVLWKFFCELLLIFFKYFESNTKKE